MWNNSEKEQLIQDIDSARIEAGELVKKLSKIQNNSLNITNEDDVEIDRLNKVIHLKDKIIQEKDETILGLEEKMKDVTSRLEEAREILDGHRSRKIRVGDQSIRIIEADSPKSVNNNNEEW